MKRRTIGNPFYWGIFLLLLFAIFFLRPTLDSTAEISYTEFIQKIENNEVKKIDLDGNRANVLTQDDTLHRVNVPFMAVPSLYDDYLKGPVEKGEIELTGQIASERNSQLFSILPTFLTIIMAWFLISFLMRNSQGGSGGMMNFGKSKAKLLEEDKGKKITFDDVAGLKEEKEELYEIVEFLRQPKKFIQMGARIPKGVLLVGPPGTGKTYLSKSVAGEAGVPFYIMSGSDFVEMYVGVGASRVRDLFEQAKKSAPCIIFIDEIDAVGRRRGAGVGGGHDEREQTLNQLLVEMDGFGTNEGVIVMAATNRADILDPALLRPGRFDRTVMVGLPDVKAREEILKVHGRKKPLSSEVDLKVQAKRTPGFTPADLENLMNEAALLAARENQSEIAPAHLDEANIKVQAGPEKKSAVISEKERKLTAVHEAGHALVSRLLPDHDPVHMITIIPRGRAGGFTAYLPEDDISHYYTKSEMKNFLVSLLGGRVAEQLVLGDISTGASNDIERATSLARDMVTRYGMSERVGTLTYGQDEDTVFMGRDFGHGRDYSEEIAALIDDEMRNLVNEAYSKAKELISENMELLLKISDALLDRETITGKEFEELFSGGSLGEESEEKNEHIERKDLTEEAKEILEEDKNKPEN